jgi:asparagine synthase (glutamine-hydrolysing)
MCGIAGIYNPGSSTIAAMAVEQITHAVTHRGPDADGFFNSGDVSLGHKRLSIIDLQECSNQPMADASGRYHIVYNGEIYNFIEVKAKLGDYPFKSEGDTEVLLAAFIKWGAACLHMFKGMFAFAIWDVETKQLFLARDRFGVKPLYYFSDGGQFYFASEIRALLASGAIPRKINTHAVSSFLQYQSVEGNETIVAGIKSLPAGTYMTVDRHGQKVERYWNIVQQKPDFDFDDEQKVKQHIYDLLLTSVQQRMVSDVPLGAFLSGGIDSSAIVGLMAQVSSEKVNTFTVGFDEKEYDESPYAKIVAEKFKTNHQQILLRPNTFLEELTPALDAMDSPSGDGVNSYVVSKAIRESGIAVALSGVGGDELFAGYPIFLQYLQLMKFRRMWKPLRTVRHLMADAVTDRNSKRSRFMQLLRSPNANIVTFYPAFRQIISPAMLADCTNLQYDASGHNELLKLDEQLYELPLLSQVSVAEYLGYTQHTLLKDMDQMSMASSLEVREPFFDHKLVEFVLHVPDELKFPDYPKKLLVDSLNGILPPEVVHRKKQGFVFPWQHWMRNDLKTFCESHLVAISGRDFIKGPQLMTYWKRFLDGDDSVRWMEMWVFVVLEYWLQKNNVG